MRVILYSILGCIGIVFGFMHVNPIWFVHLYLTESGAMPVAKITPIL